MPNMSKGTLYRGRYGMWSWVAHRVTGIAIFFFLLVHVLDTAVVRISPEAYNSVLSLYKNPIMGLGEMALVAAIVYHAFNGIRIILIDFWGPATNSKVEHIQKPNKDGIIETSEKATYNHIKNPVGCAGAVGHFCCRFCSTPPAERFRPHWRSLSHGYPAKIPRCHPAHPR